MPVTFPVCTWPLTLGHEIAGSVAEVGDGVEDFAVGDRVAVGWFGGNCNRCIPCRKGLFMQCERLQVPSWHYPGGYAESVTAPATALARIPDGLSFVEAAPMGCAGVTTFNGLRQTRAKAGDVVAVLGVGGLGHLGVQFSRAMGFETVAIARGTAKAEEAARLGAHHYIDSTGQDVAAELRKLGGAAVVLATANNAAAMADTVGGLGPAGRTGRRRGHRREAADQPARSDQLRALGDRSPVGHRTRRRGDAALRAAVRGAGHGRGAPAGGGRGGVRGDGLRARPLPDGSDRVSARRS